MAKTRRSFKRFFKRARTFKRKRKAVGFKYRNNILTGTIVKPIELTWPIYAVTSAGTPWLGGYPFGYTLATLAQFTQEVRVTTNLMSTTYTNFGTSREFVNMATLYGLMRVKSCALRYYRTIPEGQTSILSTGPISLNLSASSNGAATNQDAMTRNYSADGAMIVNPLGTNPKSKLYKWPLRSMGINNWLSPATFVDTATGGLYLQLGMPGQNLAGTGETFNVIAATTSVKLVGTAVLKLYIEFSSPMTSV